jgi:hypothetical protein
MQFFDLEPFHGNAPGLNIQIQGGVERRGARFGVHYEITGDLSLVHFPAAVKKPERKSHLWEDTCLEFFMGPRDSPGYWEFNLSPSSHWNIYRFEDYRNESRENKMLREEAFAELPFSVHPGDHRFKLDLDLDAGRILKGEEPVEMGVCAVIQTKTRNFGYWALVHGAVKPDFHERSSFILKF